MRYNHEDGYALKDLFENLFGSNAWYDIKHSTDLKKWKKYSEKALSALEKSAQTTVKIVDDEWLNEFSSIIELGKSRIESSKDFEQLFSNLAASFGELSFLQLGMRPRRKGINKITLRHPSDWKLDRYRSVQYVQNPEQREALYNKSLRSLAGTDEAGPLTKR